MSEETPFDKAQKQCANFAWNFLSSIQVYKVSNLLDTKEFDDNENATYELLLNNHCKHLSNEFIQWKKKNFTTSHILALFTMKVKT